jgi:pimeloyl-ACP methyl ester carboxylesterase
MRNHQNFEQAMVKAGKIPLQAMVISLEETFLETNGIRLHLVEAGPKEGKLLILLHGFPETWWCWKNQIEPLAQAGFRVMAPDQRGYNLSNKPHGIMAYHLDKTTGDVLGILIASGREKAFVAGHDWGGLVAWRLAERYPQVVERLAILNAPHPAVFLPSILRDPSQIGRSLYALFFQLPGLPEAMLRRDDWALVVQSLRATSRPGAFSEEDFEQYRRAWWQPGAFTAMLNWYRANFRRPPGRTSQERIRVPTLILWGAQDTALGRKLSELSAERCEDARLVYFEDATHWLQHEEPRGVNRTLINFFQGVE